MLGRLDPVEKALIDDGLPRRRHRSDQPRGLLRLGVRRSRAPPVAPVAAQGRDLRRRRPVQKGGLVEKGIADPAVAPVQQGQVIVTAAEVSRVEVPMNQGVRQAAAGKLNQSAGRPRRNAVRSLWSVGLNWLATRSETDPIASAKASARQSGKPRARSSRGAPPARPADPPADRSSSCAAPASPRRGPHPRFQPEANVSRHWPAASASARPPGAQAARLRERRRAGRP